tara:strand:+ start:340 stop:753 length:414 start_codon:yes stop_codon:yes gene_type:complete
MSNFKEVMNRVEDNRLDSMFYKSSEHTPLRRVSFREREWVIEPFGDVRLTYKDERYYCMSEISEIKTDEDITKAYDDDTLNIHYNNWYEVRPVGQEYRKYVDLGLYDDVFGDPYELDEGLLLYLLETEEQWVVEANS